jgi:heptosyltransferase-2
MATGSTYRNILAHSLVNIGDVVLVTGALALVRQACPAARITMLVRPDMADLLADHPVIDEILVLDYKGRDRSLGRQFAFLRELRRRRFDLVISFDSKLRPALLTRLAGIPARVVPERVFNDEPTRLGWLYTHVVKLPFGIADHLQADIYQEIVRQFFGIAGRGQPAIGRLSAAQHAKAAALLAEAPAGCRRIALCVKSTHALKDWPVEYFAKLIDRLHAEIGAAFLIVGAPGHREYVDRVAGLTKVIVANLCGRTSLKELAALLEMSDLLISVCTGTVHIAATRAVPTLVLYGCSSPKKWAPFNPHAVTLSRDPPCCPCSRLEDECDARDCLRKILPEEVCQAALARLAAPRATLPG